MVIIMVVAFVTAYSLSMTAGGPGVDTNIVSIYPQSSAIVFTQKQKNNRAYNYKQYKHEHTKVMDFLELFKSNYRQLV